MRKTNTSYAPELLALLKHAAVRTYHIHLAPETRADGSTRTGHAQAIQLRQRLYALRKALIEDGHELGEITKGVYLSIESHEDDSATLHAGPVDNQFRKAIENAGISIEEDMETEEKKLQNLKSMFGGANSVPTDDEQSDIISKIFPKID